MSVQYQYDPSTQTWVPVSSSSPSDPGGSQGSSGSTASPDPSSPSGGLGGSDSQLEAEKEYIDLEFNTLEGELSVRASTKSIRIRVNDTVQVEGIGKYLSGLYFVSAVTRTIDSSNGYSQSLTLIKTGFGESLKKTSDTSTSAVRYAEIPISAVSPKVGDSIRIVGDAVYSGKYEGVKVPGWMKKNTFTVGSISSDGAKILLKEADMWIYSMYAQKV